jgi:uncharacterized protein
VPTTLDANVLIYASDDDSSHREAAIETMESFIGVGESLYLFWPVLFAFLRVSTLPTVFKHPLSPEQAIGAIERLLLQPGVVCLGEGDPFFQLLRDELKQLNARGKLVHDAHLVALMRQYGVETIVTADQDFRRFDGIRVVNPFA